MRRLVLVLLAALAAACDDSQTAAPGGTLRQPVAVADFVGVTIADPANLKPYFAIANAGRNDLSVVDAVHDVPVLAPVRLESLRLPVARPALLASASLGDGLADLLVAVSAGDSVLQLVRTWAPDNAIAETVELGADVVALVALPSAPGTARLGAALAGGRLALVAYQRSGDGAIVSSGAPLTGTLPFQAESLAAIPEDGTVLYAASLEPVDGVADGVLGVGAIDVATLPAEGGAFTTRALDARAPTRLVAAARLRERAATYPPPADPATDVAPFVDQPVVDRVYAVLDESACGVAKAIDCGVAILDPDPSRGGLLADPAGRMPYLAPIQLGGRPVALAVARPPAKAPPDAPAGAPYAADAAAFMRLWPATGPVATTAVGAAALDTGSVVFLDLGRWKVANDAAILTSVSATPRSTPREVATAGGTGTAEQRLWLKPQDPAASEFLAADAGATGVTVTPGYTRSDAFSVTHQGVLPNLSQRRAEAGLTAEGAPWLALQVGQVEGGARRIVQQVAVADPTLGVHAGAGEAGDIVQIDAGAVEGCPALLAARPGGANDGRFEARAAAFLPETAEYPGGALLLEKEGDPAFDGCLDALAAKVTAGGGIATGLLATVRARGLVLTSTFLGYAGRPVLGQTYALAYPLPAEGDEDTLTGEAQVLARKARPHHHVSELCAEVCALPSGPVVRFRVDLQRDEAAPATPVRDLSLQITTAGGVTPYSTRPGSGLSSHPTGAIAYDRSPHTPSAGVRFLVPYASDVVLDVAPSNALGGPPVLIR